MEEQVKSRLILILGILAAIFCFSALSSCINAQRHKTARDKEMLTRLDLEEKMSKSGMEKQALEKKLASVNQELVQAKDALEAAKKQLIQEKAIAESLKEEVVKVTKLKDKLEDDLKDALVSARSAQQAAPIKK